MFTTVAILGAASPTGQALATRLVNGSCVLRLYDQDEAGAQRLAEQLKQLAPQADVEASPCSATASWEADLAILAMPLAAQTDTARHIAPFVTRKTVWSVADAAPYELGAVLPVLAELQRLLPHSTIRRLSGTPVRASGQPLAANDAAGLLAQLLREEAASGPEITC
jgi:glycerol-3-phosphate dehydrogenase